MHDPRKPWDQLTSPERRVRFGDCDPDQQSTAAAAYQAENVRRYLAGEPLTIDGRRQARAALFRGES